MLFLKERKKRRKIIMRKTLQLNYVIFYGLLYVLIKMNIKKNRGVKQATPIKILNIVIDLQITIFFSFDTSKNVIKKKNED